MTLIEEPTKENKENHMVTLFLTQLTGLMTGTTSEDIDLVIDQMCSAAYILQIDVNKFVSTICQQFLAWIHQNYPHEIEKTEFHQVSSLVKDKLQGPQEWLNMFNELCLIARKESGNKKSADFSTTQNRRLGVDMYQTPQSSQDKFFATFATLAVKPKVNLIRQASI